MQRWERPARGDHILSFISTLVSRSCKLYFSWFFFKVSATHSELHAYLTLLLGFFVSSVVSFPVERALCAGDVVMFLCF